MSTVLQEYRNIVLGYLPNARLVRGNDLYAIMDGNKPIGDSQVSPTIAWREASCILEREGV